MYTYPPAAPRLNEDLTAVEVHRFLQTPELVARRAQELALHRFIADFLLTGRLRALGGVVLYEDGTEPLFANDRSEAIPAGGEYPLTSFESNQMAAAQTVKWGLDHEITDESITRRIDEPVTKAFRGLTNTLVRDIDSIALAVIAARVQATEAATAPWEDDGKAIIKSVLRAKARREAALVGEAYDFNTIVLQPEAHALVSAELINSGQLRDRGSDAIATGVIPNVLGLNWVTSTHVPFSDPFFVDRDQLGAMADEKIESPGYVAADNGVGIETKAIRNDDNDKWKVRARRVCVPVVTNPNAGFRLTGTGL